MARSGSKSPVFIRPSVSTDASEIYALLEGYQGLASRDVWMSLWPELHRKWSVYVSAREADSEPTGVGIVGRFALPTHWACIGAVASRSNHAKRALSIKIRETARQFGATVLILDGVEHRLGGSQSMHYLRGNRTSRFSESGL